MNLYSPDANKFCGYMNTNSHFLFGKILVKSCVFDGQNPYIYKYFTQIPLAYFSIYDIIFIRCKISVKIYNILSANFHPRQRTIIKE